MFSLSIVFQTDFRNSSNVIKTADETLDCTPLYWLFVLYFPIIQMKKACAHTRLMGKFTYVINVYELNVTLAILPIKVKIHRAFDTRLNRRVGVPSTATVSEYVSI